MALATWWWRTVLECRLMDFKKTVCTTSTCCIAQVMGRLVSPGGSVAGVEKWSDLAQRSVNSIKVAALQLSRLSCISRAAVMDRMAHQSGNCFRQTAPRLRMMVQGQLSSAALGCCHEPVLHDHAHIIAQYAVVQASQPQLLQGDPPTVTVQAGNALIDILEVSPMMDNIKNVHFLPTQCWFRESSRSSIWSSFAG